MPDNRHQFHWLKKESENSHQAWLDLILFYLLWENLSNWKSADVTHFGNPSIYSSYEVVSESNGVKVAVGQSTPDAIMEGHSSMFSLN